MWLGGACLAMYLFMLYFRAFIYADMYIEPGDPYPISDIIEFILGALMGVLIIASCIASVLLLVNGNAQSRISAVLLVLLCLTLYLAFAPLHNMAAKYSAKMSGNSSNLTGAENAPPS
jgi:heme/copper-type cytochrome/quinol oxidase subunit 3